MHYWRENGNRSQWAMMTDDDEVIQDAGQKALASGPPQRSRLRQCIRFVCRLLAVILLTPIVICLIVTVAIIDRDITAPSWIKNRVESSTADFLSGGSLEFGEVSVNLGRDLHPRVTLSNTQLRDADGTTIAVIPVVRGLMSPRGLVYQGEALMQDVQLSGAQVNLRRNVDGTVALSFQTGGDAVEQAASFVELLDQSDQIFEQPALAALETISADGVIVNYEDARAGKAWTVDGGQISLDLRDDKTDLRGSFSVLSGAGVTDFDMSFESDRGSRAAKIGMTIEDAFAADLASQSAALSWMADIQAPISMTMRTTLDDTGTLGPLNATLALGKGALQPNSATGPIRFDTAKAYLNFDPATDTISFDQVALASDWGELRATGQAFLRDFEDGLPQSFVGQFAFTDTIINPPGLYETPLEVPQIQVDMRLKLDPFSIDLGQVFVQRGDISVLTKGRFAATDDGWDVSVDTQIPHMDHAGLLRLWPESAMFKVRRWLVNQVPEGTYTDLNLAIRNRPGQPPQMAGTYAFEDANVKFLNTMPPILGGAGVGTFTSETFSTTLSAGKILAPEGGEIDVAGSTLFIPNLRLDPRPGEYDINLRGSMTAALSLMDFHPLNLTSRAKLQPDVADGQVAVNVALTHPMKRGVVPSEVGVEVNATLFDLASNDLIPNRSLSARRLRLFANKEQLEISGAATVDGVAVDGAWVQRFDGSGSRLRAGLTLSQDALTAFNVSLPPGSVSGSSPARIDLSIPAGGAAPRYTVTSNLRGMSVAIPAVGWAKARQTPGTLRVAGRLGDDPQVEELQVSGGGLDVRGDVTFRTDGSLDRARFSRVQVGNWLNAPITLRGRGQNRPVGVEIRGGSVDLRQASFGASGGDSGPISIALDRLQVTQGIALNRFAGEFTGAGGFAGQFTAQINDVVGIQGTVAPQNGRSAVRLVSNDAGGVARATGLLRNAVGGSLDLTLLPAGGDGTFDGALAIRGLRIQDAPAIAALLDAISVVGLLQQLDGQGIAFDEVDARFRLTPQQIILTESSAVGPGLGISLDGLYTLATTQMDFQGVISPLYLINSIGSIFTRRGEGLIGFNFNIGGTASAPAVSVNPLSAFTPGMFREIFRRAPPQVSE